MVSTVVDVSWERMCRSPREPGASSVSSAGGIEERVDRCGITEDEARMLEEMLPRV